MWFQYSIQGYTKRRNRTKATERLPEELREGNSSFDAPSADSEGIELLFHVSKILVFVFIDIAADIPDDYVNPLHLDRQVRETQNRFGEPEPDFDVSYPDSILGIFSKLGSSPEGVIAAIGDIVLVDTRAFKGKTNFPADLTCLWREAGDLACLIQAWKEGDTSVVVKRPLSSDGRNMFSHPAERFVVTTTCMPERHVLCAMTNNVYLGFYQTNPEFASPEMKAWNSVRRGIPLENPQNASVYILFKL